MNNSKLKLAVFAVAAALGVAAGYVSAHLAIGYLYLPGSYRDVGPWRIPTGLGTEQTDPYSRARVAYYATWALPKSEVTYGSTDKDGDGDKLTHTCTYKIVVADDMPVRWWSLSLYRDLFFIPNADDRYSISATTARRNAAEGIEIVLNPAGLGPNALAMGEQPGTFHLLFRLYQPDAGAFTADGPTFAFPEIRKTSCVP